MRFGAVASVERFDSGGELLLLAGADISRLVGSSVRILRGNEPWSVGAVPVGRHVGTVVQADVRELSQTPLASSPFADVVAALPANTRCLYVEFETGGGAAAQEVESKASFFQALTPQFSIGVAGRAYEITEEALLAPVKILGNLDVAKPQSTMRTIKRSRIDELAIHDHPVDPLNRVFRLYDSPVKPKGAK